MKGKKYILIIIFITLIIGISIFIKYNKRKDKIITNINLTSDLDCITQREMLIQDEIIFIGNNKKELENGYFDIKIQKIDNGIKLQIDKLIKNHQNSEIYDKEYIIELLNYLNHKFNNSLNIEKILSEISSLYLKLRTKINENEYENIEYKDKDYNIKIYILNYSMFIEIWRNDV